MRRVLLIDGDEACSWALTRLLELDGFKVVVRRDAASALEAMRREMFNAVVSCVGAPDTSGYHAVEEVRDTQPNIILIMLVWDRNVVAKTSRDVVILQKPIDYIELHRILLR